MFAKVLFSLVVIVGAVSASTDETLLNRFRGHVRKVNGKFEVTTALETAYEQPQTNIEQITATAFWDQTYNVTGWSILEIKTVENQSNADQAYSAGLLEGKLTRDITKMQWKNSIDDICNGQDQFCGQLRLFLQVQLDWIYSKVEAYPDEEYWHQIGLLLIQLNGLIDGHEDNQRGPRMKIDDPLGFFLFQIVESVGDIRNRLGFGDIDRIDSCSALVKILPDNADIFISHADWSNYKTMLKVIKRYIMPLKRTAEAGSPLIDGAENVFSSYPGTLHSVDDFYMMNPAQITVIETTIVNYNTELNHQINPISVPEWMRVVVSNRLSNSGQEWIDRFFAFNDGTYNNQWMIADYKKFTPGQPAKPGFLMVAEQMVGDFEYQDMTDTLNNATYWASYNNVYFPRFRNISGEEQMAQKKGPQLYSWTNSSRAQIFGRDHHKVVNLTTMISMMRYNDFKNDPYSRCDCDPPYSAELTIAARCDLNNATGKYPDSPLGHRVHGATDAKITSHAMMQNFTLVAISGPTHDQQPPFVWSESDFDKTVSHIGHPDRWEFGPITPVWMLT